MKTKVGILSALAALCLLGTGIYAWALHDAHLKQVEEWKEGAKAAFEESLWMEVDKRSEIEFYSYEKVTEGVTSLKTKIPDTVSMMTKGGLRKYKIDRYKYDHSLIKETRGRGDLGILLEFYPLSIDTLSMHLDSLLMEKQIPLQAQVRYVYTDEEMRNDTVYTCSDSHSGLDSLTVKYLGFRCEHELMAFVASPQWLQGLSWGAWFGLVLPWVAWVLLLVFYAPVEAYFRRKFVSEKVVEKEIHVADVTIDKAMVYRLSETILFDSFAGTLMSGDTTYTLTPQSSLLLKLFLRKENHRLSPEEIMQELWKGNATSDQMYKAIQRLRKELQKASSEIVIKNVNGDYELK